MVLITAALLSLLPFLASVEGVDITAYREETCGAKNPQRFPALICRDIRPNVCCALPSNGYVAKSVRFSGETEAPCGAHLEWYQPNGKLSCGQRRESKNVNEKYNVCLKNDKNVMGGGAAWRERKARPGSKQCKIGKRETELPEETTPEQLSARGLKPGTFHKVGNVLKDNAGNIIDAGQLANSIAGLLQQRDVDESDSHLEARKFRAGNHIGTIIDAGNLATSIAGLIHQRDVNDEDSHLEARKFRAGNHIGTIIDAGNLATSIAGLIHQRD
ncbi:MAG: hypothetical protein M1829_005559, partial [Trizodia sp. TS-e1964]